MGKPTGFLEVERHDRSYAPVEERIRHYDEFLRDMSAREVVEQASRCMDCGIPFCHTGCPVNNQIPDWNDLVYHKDWQDACINLHAREIIFTHPVKKTKERIKASLPENQFWEQFLVFDKVKVKEDEWN